MHTLMSGAQHLPQNIGRVLRQERSVVEGYAKEVYITGRKLRSYNLTAYRSFSIDINSKTKAAGKEIELAVRKDGRNAVDKEMVELAGRLYFAVYSLKQTDSKQNRYLFYKNNALKKEDIASAYDVNEEDISIIEYEIVDSIKITFPRKHISGSLADNDIYGCQQHMPLANIEL